MTIKYTDSENNYALYLEKDKFPIKAWVHGVELEAEALNQLRNLASMPFIFKHIAVMPDVHAGLGATVGSVVPTKGAIIPSSVGVDIGCGMIACKLNIKSSDLPDSLKDIREAIESTVPVGKEGNTEIDSKTFDIFNSQFKSGYEKIIDKYPEIKKKDVLNQLGSLGGGNHFIELCLDENQNVWLMLHSGSRGIGNRIGTVFISLAKEDMKRHQINLPDKDLAYLIEGTELFEDYWNALTWAQNYASYNRIIMKHKILNILNKRKDDLKIPEINLYNHADVVSCHHNYATIENHFGENIYLTRKGAVRAGEGEYGIIPGSMGDKSYIVRGKGNKESFLSCSHGAGRRMSRSKAKATFTLEDQIKATQGVECRKDFGVIDEIPMAYKNIDAVMEAQKDLVEVVHTLKQVLCVKG